MAIIRGERPSSNFYILDKSISEDARLSWDSRGLLIYLLGKPDNWKVSITHLVNQTSRSEKPVGKKRLYSMLKELEDAGYVQRKSVRNESGKYDGIDYVVSEHPIEKTPLTPEGDAAKRHAAKEQQTSIETTTRIESVNKSLVPSVDGTPVSRKNEYPDDFESTWRTYPKRAGGNPKRSAFKAWSARIKDGATTEEILLGVERYRKFIAATGKQNTQFVMQAATFFGPDERFREDWEAPDQAAKSNGIAQPLQQGSYTPADEDLPDWLKDTGDGQ